MAALLLSIAELNEKLVDLTAVLGSLLFDVQLDQSCLNEWQNLTQWNWILFDGVFVVRVARVHELSDFVLIFAEFFHVAQVQMMEQALDHLLGLQEFLCRVEITVKVAPVSTFQLGDVLDVGLLEMLVDSRPESLSQVVKENDKLSRVDI